jgi:hypothetical protein
MSCPVPWHVTQFPGPACQHAIQLHFFSPSQCQHFTATLRRVSFAASFGFGEAAEPRQNTCFSSSRTSQSSAASVSIGFSSSCACDAPEAPVAFGDACDQCDDGLRVFSESEISRLPLPGSRINSTSTPT